MITKLRLFGICVVLFAFYGLGCNGGGGDDDGDVMEMQSETTTSAELNSAVESQIARSELDNLDVSGIWAIVVNYGSGEVVASDGRREILNPPITTSGEILLDQNGSNVSGKTPRGEEVSGIVDRRSIVFSWRGEPSLSQGCRSASQHTLSGTIVDNNRMEGSGNYVGLTTCVSGDAAGNAPIQWVAIRK